MSRTISWIVAWLAIAISVLLAFQETTKYFQGPEPDSIEADAEQNDIVLPQEFEGEDLLAKADGEQEGRRYLVEHLAKKLGLPMTAISVGSAVGDTKAKVRITCTEKQRKAVDDRLDDLQFPLRLLEIVDITLQTADGKLLEVYTVGPDTLGYPISRELVFFEMLQGVCKPAADAVANSCITHLNKCIQKNALDPALVAYRYVLDRETGAKTVTDCAILEGIKNSTADEDRAEIASRLQQVAGCTEFSTTKLKTPNGLTELETLNADELAQFVRDHLCPDIVRSYLIKYIYERDNQPDKVKAAINELPDDRGEVNRSIAVDAFSVIISGLLLLWYFLQKKKLHQLPAIDEAQVMCPEPYGWIRSFLIGTVTVVCIALGFAFMFIVTPEQMEESSALLNAYFEPVKTALTGNFEESVLVAPFMMAAFVLVGSKLNFLEFIKLRFKTEQYGTLGLVKIGVQCLALTWAPAMVATLLSYWFHYPWEKASSVQTELLIASDSMPAILILLLGYAVIAPVLEEAAFRGVLHPALRRKFQMWPSIIIGAAFFAIVHLEFSPWWIIDKFIFSAVNAYAVEKTGSIVPGIVNHMLTNLMVVIFMFIALS